MTTTPGLVCGHHHLYSSLARGMPAPPKVPRNFPEILEQVWWRLDRALDLELVAWSARLGALEAFEAGTTLIYDHHSSPDAIEGSLDVVAAACAEVGVRVVCCYEVTDRNGPDGAAAGLAENARFLRAGGDGMVGAHACFTLSDDTLHAVAGLAGDLDAGVHIHVAEDRCDGEAGARLEAVARPNWRLAHCVHLDRRLAGTIAHNPRSNLVNGVGYARPARWPNPKELGTDGIGGDMLEEFRLAFACHRADDVTATPEAAWSWLATDDRAEVVWSSESCDSRSGHGDPGATLATGSLAPFGDPWQLAYTSGVRPLEVRVDGEVVLKEGRPTRVDPDEIRARAREEAVRLWSRL